MPQQRIRLVEIAVSFWLGLTGHLPFHSGGSEDLMVAVDEAEMASETIPFCYLRPERDLMN